MTEPTKPKRTKKPQPEPTDDAHFALAVLDEFEHDNFDMEVGKYASEPRLYYGKKKLVALVRFAIIATRAQVDEQVLAILDKAEDRYRKQIQEAVAIARRNAISETRAQMKKEMKK